MLINRVGRRLANLGFPPNGDIYEEPSTTVDLAVNFRPWPNWRGGQVPAWRVVNRDPWC